MREISQSLQEETIFTRCDLRICGSVFAVIIIRINAAASRRTRVMSQADSSGNARLIVVGVYIRLSTDIVAATWCILGND